MQILCNKFVKNRNYILLFVSIGFAMLTLILSSCRASISVQQGSQNPVDSLLEIKYSIIFIIHGNGDYLYFDNSGNQIEADEVALTEAIRIALQNPYAEVFIFHQKPTQHFLFFFPLKDGEFYYYRNGKPIANELYWRNQEKSNLNFEVAAYHRFSKSNQSNLIKMFLYFGHEIPEFGGVGYDESYSDRTFTIDDLATEFNGFTTDSSKFDLTILAACFGGTPYTVNKLGNFSRTIIASPENLHLSYFDLHSFERLDNNLKNGDVHSFANKIARESFEKLTKNVQTEVSVVVYDVEKVKIYLNSVNANYAATLRSMKELTPANLADIDHCDCVEIPAYQISIINNGVDVYYRSARFGKSKNKMNHSGWECWKY
jgi:hypothetical protein